MTAYDYNRQTWVSGRSGAEARLSQLEADVELLTGPRRDDYLKFMGHSNMTEAQIASAVEVIKRGIDECKFVLAQDAVVTAGNGRLAVLNDFLATMEEVS